MAFDTLQVKAVEGLFIKFYKYDRPSVNRPIIKWRGQGNRYRGEFERNGFELERNDFELGRNDLFPLETFHKTVSGVPVSSFHFARNKVLKFQALTETTGNLPSNTIHFLKQKKLFACSIASELHEIVVHQKQKKSSSQ